MSKIEIHSTAIVQDSSDLTSKTKFLRVSFGLLGNTRKVKDATLNTTAPAKSRFKTSKDLLDSPELDAVRQFDAVLRKYLERKCLPFVDWPGVLVVPDQFVPQVWATLLQHREERHALVANFLSRYPELKDEAKVDLGDEYEEENYPPIEEVSKKFRFYWSIRTFQTPEELKEISEELYQEQKVSAQAQFSSAMEEITAVLRQKFFEMTEHLRDKLTPSPDGKKKKLYDSSVVSLKEFLDDFDVRDITNDTQLREQVAKARALLDDGDVSTLRTSEEFRTKVFAGMDEITQTLGTLVQEVPSRKFRLDED